jgi:hypothetical protein
VHGEYVKKNRILAMTFGLLIASAALYFLATGAPSSYETAGPPHESIDDESRQKLDSVLRGADG